MKFPLIICPPCQRPIPEHQVQWAAKSALCPSCDLELFLYGDLLPSSASAQMLLDAAMSSRGFEKPATSKLSVSASDTQASIGVGRVLGRKITINASGVEIRPTLRRRGTLFQRGEVYGFVPIQHLEWKAAGVASAPSSTWRVMLLLAAGQWCAVYPSDTWEQSRHLSLVLNEQILRLWGPTSPYRD
jgi:hypothetical protein